MRMQRTRSSNGGGSKTIAPEGWHDGRICFVEDRTSGNGNPMAYVKFDVGPDYFWPELRAAEGTSWWNQLVDLIGDNGDSSDLKGKNVSIEIVHERGESRTFANVNQVKARYEEPRSQVADDDDIPF